jgi:hypothetical protein
LSNIVTVFIKIWFRETSILSLEFIFFLILGFALNLVIIFRELWRREILTAVFFRYFQWFIYWNFNLSQCVFFVFIDDFILIILWYGQVWNIRQNFFWIVETNRKVFEFTLSYLNSAISILFYFMIFIILLIFILLL